MDAVLLDIDGTLVDSNFHHAVAWHRALADLGKLVPTPILLRHVGMGGDRYLEAVVDADFDARHGERARELHSEYFAELSDWLRPMPGARELVDRLVERGLRVVLATSADESDVRRLLAPLDLGPDDFHGLVDSGDVDASKPAPEVFVSALERAGCEPDQALAVGDTVWDVHAATAAGVAVAALATGGTSQQELAAEGAQWTFADAGELLLHLDQLLQAPATR